MTDSNEHFMPTAGPEHALLQPFEGTFRATVKIYMGPGDPMVQQGTMHNSFQMRGLYLHQDYVGDPAPEPWPSFLGKGYWGFNPFSRLYEGFWIDNASSVMQLETGEVDPAGTTWTMHSEIKDPRSGQQLAKRTMIRLIDQDHHSMETFTTLPDGTEILSMSISYERASQA